MKTVPVSVSAGLLCAASFVSAQHYQAKDLVANTSGAAPVKDANLVNAWGISRSSNGDWWVSDNGTGKSTLYNGAGTRSSLVVTIPKADPNSKTFPTGTPTGTIFNGSQTDFLLPGGKPAIFLFATLDGAISGWNPAVPGGATTAITVEVAKDGSSYSGLTSALVHGERFLYVANFGKGRVDVFDNAFHAVSPAQLEVRAEAEAADAAERYADRGYSRGGPFTDDRLPAHFAPFNVQAIGNDVVVTYAEQPDKPGPEVDGPGLGYVDVFSSTGKLIRRLEHGDWLNAPWGVALAPLDFGRFSHDLLVGQFGGGGTGESAGYIAAYDLATGKLDGLLEDAAGKPLVVQGVWGLSVGNVAPGNLDPAGSPSGEVYFGAGPKNGTAGSFGYLTAVPTDLVEGNDQ